MWNNYPIFALTPGMKLVLAILVIWSLIWKGVALWKAARNSHTAWYVIMLIVNTAGILEIIYIFGFSKKRSNSLPSATGQQM
jgi:methionyl-tRNA synthetase